jgi:YYY domain-containing protein
LLSDFHAHVLTLAFTILAAGLALNLLLEKDGIGLSAFGRGWQMPLTLLITALGMGELFAMNGWDMPTYLGLTIICISLQQWFSYKCTFSLTLLIDIVTTVIILATCSFILFIPFYLNFNSPAQGLGLVQPQDRSPLGNVFLIYGLFLFLFVSLLIICIKKSLLFQQPSENTEVEMYRHLNKILTALCALLIINVIILLFLKESITLVLMANIVLIGIALTLYYIRDRGLAFTLLLGTVAFFLVAFCEVVFLRDVFAGNFPRMNTVFKFYFQAWALLSIASGCGMYFLWTALWPLRISKSIGHISLLATKGLWLQALLLLLIASTAYPILAPPARLQEFNPTTLTYSLKSGNSMDGLNYLQNCRPPAPASDFFYFCTMDVTDDYYAIRWINSHIQGDPIIVETVGSDYSLFSRVSALTGLPTLMGWIGHEEQWRLNWLNNPDNTQSFRDQINAVNTIYTSPDPQQVLNTMKKYHAVYLYVGPVERLCYNNAPHVDHLRQLCYNNAPANFDLSRFGHFMDVVYAEHGVTIYKIRE